MSIELLFEGAKDDRPSDAINNIKFVGPATLAVWKEKNITTLKELKKRIAQGEIRLSRSQQIGLTYHYDLSQPIPREEAERIIKHIESVAAPDIAVYAAGSYRRGHAFSRDIDIIITDNNKRGGALVDSPLANELLKRLGKKVDVITAGKLRTSILYRSDEYIRHIDVLSVQRESLAAALLHFTGSREFNIAMSSIARAQSMRLNLYGLYKGKEKIETRTEQDIFNILGVKYLEPQERDTELIHHQRRD